MAAKKPAEQTAAAKRETDKKKPEAVASKPTTAREKPKVQTGKEITQEPEKGAEGTTAAQAWKVSRLLRVTLPLMEGEDVRALQLALIAAGYHCGIKGASGVYGRETAQAVRFYQAYHGMIVDGKAGKYTVQRLGGVWEPEA